MSGVLICNRRRRSKEFVILVGEEVAEINNYVIWDRLYIIMDK